MQFNVLTVLVASMASLAVAETVTVYACDATATPTTVAVASSGAASATGYASGTGAISSASATTSPIAYATNGAALNGVSAFGMVVAAGVALMI